MRTSIFVTRKFASAAMERAFRMDYARRFAGQRRLACATLLLIWIAVVWRDWLLLGKYGFGVFIPVCEMRVAGALGMALSLSMMWGRRMLNENQAVGLLSMVILSCWFASLALVKVYPPNLVGKEIFPGFFVAMFLIFTLFRLRAVTAFWLVGLCVVTYHLREFVQYSWNSSTPWEHWFTRGAIVFTMYLAGIVVCVQFELAARREFRFRRSLRAAKARVEASSRAVTQQNERMQEVVRERERFFSSAYHDIQQPLAAINLFIRSARTKLEEEHKASQDLDVIEETARDILDMFKDIQDYSELGSYTPRVSAVDSQTVLSEVFQQYTELAKARGIALRFSLRGRPAPQIESDRALFKRALSNVLSNAIKYTAVGGVVLGWVALRGQLRIDVRDTGVGIAPAHREAIFAEYYQIDNPGRDRARGLGLGLSIVQRVIGILPKHSLSWQSVEGRGTRFSLYAPLSKATPEIESGNRKDDAESANLDGKYLLLCDDDPIVLEGLRRLFSSAGALVESAGSLTGFDALLADDSRVPDAIVTDMRLCDGQTGIELAERLRRHFDWAGTVPVVFITGELTSSHALENFAQPFLSLRKSASPEDTLAEVSHIVSANSSPYARHAPGPIETGKKT